MVALLNHPKAMFRYVWTNFETKNNNESLKEEKIAVINGLIM